MIRGITIIELLASLFVISIVISILTISIHSINATTIQTQASQDLKTLSTLSNKWAIDYDHYPFALSWKNNKLIAWDFVANDDNSWSPAKLWEYGTNKPFLRPDIKKTIIPGQTGYNYNTSYIGGESPYGEHSTSPNARQSLRLSHIKRSAKTVCFGLSSEVGGEFNRWMRSPMRVNIEGKHNPEPFETVYAGAQSFLLNGLSLGSHLDGHVGSFHTPKKGVHHENLPLWITSSLKYPENGFLSSNDEAYRPW